MGSVRLTKKPVTVDGASVSDLLYLFKYNGSGLPDWVIAAHNEGRLLFADQTLTVRVGGFNQTVDYRWWLIREPNGVLRPMTEHDVWEDYDKEVN